MSGNSNVGNSQIYEDGDQKNVPRSEIEQAKKEKRFHEGKDNSHKANDSSKRERFCRCSAQGNTNDHLPEDERSIANKLAREEKVGP
jgi:hypothetical protein